jgi:hypothetical protein
MPKKNTRPGTEPGGQVLGGLFVKRGLQLSRQLAKEIDDACGARGAGEETFAVFARKAFENELRRRKTGGGGGGLVLELKGDLAQLIKEASDRTGVPAAVLAREILIKGIGAWIGDKLAQEDKALAEARERLARKT